MIVNTRGLLLVISSPSGTGKTTLCRRLLADEPNLSFSVSYTTRPARGGERDGVDYHFVSDEVFGEMVAARRFAEWAAVHSNRYGTAADTVDQRLDAGQDLIFDIDWQGGQQLLERYPDDTVLVFVLPPSFPELERRLRGRGTDSDRVIRQRLEAAHRELDAAGRYHYLVLNDQLEQAYRQLRAIYTAARAERRRQEPLLRHLLGSWEPASGGTGGELSER